MQLFKVLNQWFYNENWHIQWKLIILGILILVNKYIRIENEVVFSIYII